MGIFKNWMKRDTEKKETSGNGTAKTELSGNEAVSPVSGELVLLESVGDPVFAEKTLGDGIAVIPSEGRLVAPADGTIVAMFPTGHALGLRTNTGVELLIHIGIDTVALNGKGFTIHAQADEAVKVGQLLVSFDIDEIKKAGYDTVTMMLVSNGDQFGELHKREPGIVKAGERVMWL